MKKIRVFLLVFLIVFNYFLLSKISSRIVGIVVEEGTNNPIKNAELILYQYNSEYGNKIWDFKTKSDDKGTFEFNSEDLSLLVSARYFNIVQCTHDDFINLYPHIPYKIHQFDEGNDYSTFVLDEGEIKYLKIELKKGGGIKGNLKYKIGSEIRPISNFSFSVDQNVGEHSIEIQSLKTDENGNFKKNGIPPGNNYYLTFFLNGYTIKHSNTFSIDYGNITRVDYILNLENNNGIKGHITIKGEIPNNGIDITLIKYNTQSGSQDNCFCDFFSRLNEYFCYNLEPGQYKLLVNANLNEVLYSRTLKIIIESNKTVIYDINLNERDIIE